MGETCNVSTFAIVMLIVFQTGDSSLTTHTLQACYGNGFEDFLTPSCSSGEQIHVFDVYVYAKRKELNCPQTATFADRNITYCCNYVSVKEDCGQRYFGSASEFQHAHYSRCAGLETCGGIPVAWNYTEHFCNTTIFSEKTNYMKMWYNCIPDTIAINSASSLTANAVFLSSESYPSTIPECSTTSGATCAVQTTNGSPIQITTLDLQFSETNGVCLQRLYITDGATNTEIACNHNNQFAKRVVFTSTSNSIEIRLDNTATLTTGKFWIQIEGTESSDNVTIKCRNDAAVYGCGSSLDLSDSKTDSTLSVSYETTTTTTTSADKTEVSTTTTTSADITEVSTTTTTSADMTEVSTTTTTSADITEVSTTTATSADITEVSTTTATSADITEVSTTTTTSADITEVSTTTATSADITEVSTTTITPTDITDETITTSNTSTSKVESESSDSNLDLSWIVTIFLGSLTTGVVFGSIMYAINRCKKKCTQVKDNGTPRRRIAFQ